MQVAFILLASGGTSEVIVNVLRVLYILSQAFMLGMLIWFCKFTFQIPVLIDKELD